MASSGPPRSTGVEIYNQLSDLAADFVALEQPALRTKLIKADLVEGNEYNPNRVAPPEMKLLHISMKKDGITMPVVAAHDKKKFVVVDGFHRTAIIKSKKDIRESTGGYIPLVELNKNIDDRITATVRHNMARGTHQVELSAKLVVLLRKHNWTDKRIGLELGMEADLKPDDAS